MYMILIVSAVVLFSGVKGQTPFESTLTFDAHPFTWTVQRDDETIVYYLPCKLMGSATLPHVPPKAGGATRYIEMENVTITDFQCAGRELK